MLERIEIKGIWWLPENPDKQLPGTLTFSQDEGPFLELVGVFEDRLADHGVRNPTIILGISQSGKQVTLYRCIYTQGTIPVSGLGGATYKAHFVFEGVHFNDEADIQFHNLSANYTDLDAWVDIYGFLIEENLDDGKIKFIINYEKPEGTYIEVDDGFEVGVGFSSHGPTWSIIQTEVKISQRAYFITKSTKGDVPFEVMFSLLQKFVILHQIATQRMTYPVVILGLTEANARELNEGKIIHPEVNVYFDPIEAYIERKALIPQEMLFTFKDLDEALIKNWFNAFDKYQTVIHLYRTLFYSNRLFIETRFLNIALALESLHTILFENRYLPKEEFSERRQKVLEALPDNLRQWVDDALKNANYKRFRLKMYELLENKHKLLSRCIMDVDQFSKRVTHTRNEFIHHNKQKESFRGNEELLSAINLMMYLFEAYILEIIGFSDKQIQEMFEPRVDKYLSRWMKL